MFRKKLNVDEMSSEEMHAFLSSVLKKLIWLNALWLLFVFGVLFWNPAIGVILLIITGAKYFHDYHDVDSQEHHVNFLERMLIKSVQERKHD